MWVGLMLIVVVSILAVLQPVQLLTSFGLVSHQLFGDSRLWGDRILLLLNQSDHNSGADHHRNHY